VTVPDSPAPAQPDPAPASASPAAVDGVATAAADGVEAGDLRIGAPEREAARDALDEHLEAERLTDAEHEQRCAAAEAARTRSELMRLFEDLPEPHPYLPSAAPATKDDDEDVSALGWAVGILLGFGLPVAVVLGVVYDAWWSLAVPVGVGVLMVYVEHLLNRKREPSAPTEPPR
jgi:uncharacterized protein DUF1707